MAHSDLHKPGYDNTYVERDRERIETPRSSSGSAIAFIVGGLVVAAAVLFWLFSAGGDVDTVTPAASGDVSVTVEGDETAPAAAAPANDTAAPAETAPAAPAPAPAADSTADETAPAPAANN